MSTGFIEKDYTGFTSTSDAKVKSFLNDLRNLLDKHGIKLYSHDCEVYIEGHGYIGYLEDNVRTVDIVEGEETLYTSKESKIVDV